MVTRPVGGSGMTGNAGGPAGGPVAGGGPWPAPLPAGKLLCVAQALGPRDWQGLLL